MRTCVSRGFERNKLSIYSSILALQAMPLGIFKSQKAKYMSLIYSTLSYYGILTNNTDAKILLAVNRHGNVSLLS